MLKINFSLPRLALAAAVILFAAALIAGVPLEASAMDSGVALLAMANGVAAPAADRPTVSWGRKREPMKAFSNVPAGVPATVTTAFSKIPRYPRTILGFMLQLGGTTFTKALISRIELFLGEKSIYGPVSGAEQDFVNLYTMGVRAQSDFFLPIDFTYPNVKEIGGEQIGGIDLTMLPPGELRLEVDLAVGVSAPTLRGDVIWAPPQGGGDLGGLMAKLVRRTYPQAAAGDFFPDVNLRGAIIARQFFVSTVANAAVSAARGIGGGANTGNGAMGAITVAARTRTGRYRLTVTEPAANAGTFAVFDPDGRLIDTGTVAVAFNAGGLAFTLADGAADFVAGDGFNIDVLPLNTDQNINSLELKKNEDVWWFRSDRAARYEQERYGRQPLTQLYVADFLLDNHGDSVLDSANAAALDYKLNLTAADTITLISQVLAQPTLF